LLIVSHPALIADADPARWLHVHAAAAQRRRTELLSVETAPADVARTWEWAKHCVAMQAHRPEPDAALVLAHIVIGDFATARKLLTPALTPHFHAALGDDATAVPPAPPDPAIADWQPAGDPATLITSFARAVLGYAPDAARGRLTLRLRLPAGWDRASVHNIPVGDARIRLTCERNLELMRLVIVQTAGAYPIRLILEPVLARAPARVNVDGVAAQLNLRSSGDRVLAPLQIMLDAERTVVFEF
jgi:hypothetical protein